MSDDIRADIRAVIDGNLGEATSEDVAPVDVPAAEAGAGGDAGVAAGAETAGGAEASAAGDETPEARAGADARSRDGKGRFAPKGVAPAAPVAPKPAAPVATVGVGAGDPQAPASNGAAYKAPPHWKPGAREEWAKLPPSVQAEVHRVERDTKVALQEAAAAKRFHEDFGRTVGPYAGMIQAEGAQPAQFIGSLLQTAQALRMGAPGTKAQMVANIIREFGVPVEGVAAALDGHAPPQGQAPGGGPAEYRDPRVDQLFGTLQQAHQQRQAAVTERAVGELKAFEAQAEFLGDVRGHMSVLLSDAAQRGQKMSLQEAYERACWADPEVRVYFQQREAAKAANATQASTQRARAASSSIRSQPATASSAVESRGSVADDIREVLGKLNSR